MTTRRQALRDWVLYDAGLAAFNTLVMTFIFAVYTVHTLASDAATGTAAWGGMLATAGIAVLLLSPLAGLLTRGYPNASLRGLTVICMGGTGLLFLATPATGLTYALLCAGVATVAYELTFIPYSARLPALTTSATLTRWSGYGWAAGYLGGLLVLGLALVLLVGDTAPFARLFGTDASLNIRATAPLAVLWMLVLCTPLLLARTPSVEVIEQHSWLAAWRQCATRPGLLRFIVASALYRDGLATIFGFGGIYAASVHGFALHDVLVFGIALNFGSGLGAAVCARLDRHLSPLAIIRLSLLGLMLSGILVLLAPSTPFGVTLFWGAALLLSLWFGPAQAAGRAYLLLEAGPAQTTAALSLYTVTGRAANFIGPALYGAAVGLTGLQQAGMGTVLILFVVALLVLPRQLSKPATPLMTAA